MRHLEDSKTSVFSVTPRHFNFSNSKTSKCSKCAHTIQTLKYSDVIYYKMHIMAKTPKTVRPVRFDKILQGA